MLNISCSWRILVKQVCVRRVYLIVWNWLPGRCLEVAPSLAISGDLLELHRVARGALCTEVNALLLLWCCLSCWWSWLLCELHTLYNHLRSLVVRFALILDILLARLSKSRGCGCHACLPNWACPWVIELRQSLLSVRNEGICIQNASLGGLCRMCIISGEGTHDSEAGCKDVLSIQSSSYRGRSSLSVCSVVNKKLKHNLFAGSRGDSGCRSGSIVQRLPCFGRRAILGLVDGL